MEVVGLSPVYPGLFTRRHFQRPKSSRAASCFFVRVDGGDQRAPAPFPSGPVDGLVSEGIEQKASATMLRVANPEIPDARARAMVVACRRETSHREVMPKGRASEVV